MKEESPGEDPPLPDGQVSILWRYTRMMLIWALPGLVLLPFGRVLWQDLSGASHDLGSVVFLYQYALFGLVAGAAVGAALASTPSAVQAKALLVGKIVDAVLLVSLFLFFFTALVL